MKKLMIAAAIVCAAVVSQAASIDWSFDEVVAANPAAPVYKGPADLSGMTLYIFESSVWSGAALEGGGYEASVLDLAWDHKTIGDKVVAKEGTAQETWTWKANNAGVTNGSIDKDAAYNLVFVVSDGSKFQAINGAQAAVGYDPQAAGSVTAGTLSLKANSASQFTTAGMSSFAVPEPTSGLLLLLGVAGLALRRKHA